jgi:cupin superfamily acireductone dioxygenase involved in methionine salvage
MKFYEVYDFNQDGYQKLFSFKSWRIAILNYIDELEVENIKYFECHKKTDEAFVLLNGSCTLFFGETNKKQITDIQSIKMEAHKVYNIPKGIYHSHTLSKDGKVLIIEQENTSNKNSHRINLNDELIKKLAKKG